MIRWILGGAAVIVLAVGGLVGVRTSQYGASAPAVAAAASAAAPAISVDVQTAAARLGEAIRFQTVSVQAGDAWDSAPFAAQRAWLERTYPAFHAATTRELVNGESLLYTWKGSEASKPPILMLAHLDVVPFDPATRDRWSGDAFAGAVRDGAIWGRGAVDDKGSLIAILEAAEALAKSGFKPKRTIIFAFGHDEEVSGVNGAKTMAELLKTRGIKAWFAIDEGMAILENYPLTGGPVALIGISEKGFATIKVTATARPGHSSMPDSDTAVTLLSEAILRIHRMPIAMRIEGGPAEGMMRALAPQLPGAIRVAVANEWLLSPLINQQLGADPRAAALMRTTVAPTMLTASPKENVLPGTATAMINFRLHPRDSAASILARARDAVRTIPGVTVEWAAEPSEASPVSSTTSDSYALIARVAAEAAGGAPVAPTLVLGGTDSKHYVGVAENVYRFAPAMYSDAEIAGVHGVDEHLTIANLDRMIRGYARLMTDGAG